MKVGIRFVAITSIVALILGILGQASVSVYASDLSAGDSSEMLSENDDFLPEENKNLENDIVPNEEEKSVSNSDIQEDESYTEALNEDDEIIELTTEEDSGEEQIERVEDESEENAEDAEGYDSGDVLGEVISEEPGIDINNAILELEDSFSSNGAETLQESDASALESDKESDSSFSDVGMRLWRPLSAIIGEKYEKK